MRGHSNGENAFLRWAIDCLRQDMSEMAKRLMVLEDRLRAMESQRSLFALILALKELAKAIAPLKEWLLILVLIILALKGLLSQEDAGAALRSLLGTR